MQPGVPNKPMPPQYQAPYAGGTSGGRGCGCFAFGCGGLLLGLIALCGIGYYSLLYSNLPLRFVQQALESSGNVKIEGLKGNLNTGFEMTKLRFKDDSRRADGEPTPWSELTDIRIKYRNGGIFSSSFTLEEIRIGGGTIYGDLNFDSELSGELIFDEIQDEFSDFQSEFSGGSRGTLAVQNISLTNLTIRDSRTDDSFRIEEISLSDVMIENGRLVEFGDLVVKADSIELETLRSETFPEAELERTFKGRLEKGMLANLLTDIPFEIEFGVMPDGEIATRSRWFDGQIESSVGLPDEANRYRISGFSPDEHLQLRRGGVSPRDIQLAIVYDEQNKQEIASIEPGGSIVFGQSKFEKFRLAKTDDDDRPNRRYFLATAEVEGREVEAELYLLKRLPLVGVRLQKTGDWSLEETWARTLFGKAYGDLEEEERDRLQESLSQAERRFRSPNDASERSSRESRRNRRGRNDVPADEDRSESTDEGESRADDQVDGDGDSSPEVQPSTTDQPSEEQPTTDRDDG